MIAPRAASAGGDPQAVAGAPNRTRTAIRVECKLATNVFVLGAHASAGLLFDSKGCSRILLRYPYSAFNKIPQLRAPSYSP